VSAPAVCGALGRIPLNVLANEDAPIISRACDGRGDPKSPKRFIVIVVFLGQFSELN